MMGESPENCQEHVIFHHKIKEMILGLKCNVYYFHLKYFNFIVLFVVVLHLLMMYVNTNVH